MEKIGILKSNYIIFAYLYVPLKTKKMKKRMFFSALALIMICLCGCSNGKSEKNIKVVGDTVAMATINLHDTMNYSIVDGKKCHISADVEITYPKTYIDNEKTEQLQKLYTTNVLNVLSDSVSLASAFPHYVDDLINQYKENGVDIADGDIEIDYEPMTDCKLQVRIYPVYNTEGLLSVCKEEIALVDDKLPAKRHFYYVFNLFEMDKLEISDIYTEEVINQVAELLKNKLRRDLNVVSDDELADLGYYNFDNLTVSENFYLTSDSIVWNFHPWELSVLEEVRISLSRSEIDY